MNFETEMSVRILFVVTNNSVVECHGPMILSSLARQRGHETLFERFNASKIRKILKEWGPDIIAWSAMSPDFRHMALLNDSLKKEFDFVSIFGGPHPTYLPISLFDHEIDYGVIGEGEYAFLELIDALNNHDECCKISNVISKKNQKVDMRPFISNLDNLPIADYSNFYNADKWLKEFPVKMFVPSRGCPYACSYCFNKQLRDIYKNERSSVRRFSVNRLIEEVLYVKRQFPLEFINFSDDCFVYRRDIKWLEEFCVEYPRKVGLPFRCFINPKDITNDIISMLAGAGLKSVFTSIECGSEYYRKKILNRAITDNDLLNAFSILNKYKVNVLACSILALPGSTFKDDLKTLEINIKYKPTWGVAAIFQPYPKLPLTIYATENGFYDDGMNKNIYPSTFYGKSLLNFTEDTKSKQKNLSDIFCLLVNYPFLSKLLLPFIGLRFVIAPFIILDKFLVAYILQKKIYPHRLTWNRVFKYLMAFMKYSLQIVKEK